MKVMYVAPRYHTNQIAIMKGWIERGDKVAFLSQYAGKSEDYTWVTPEIIGYSKVFLMVNYFYTHFLKRNDPYRDDWRLKCGFPPMGKLKKKIKEYAPDLVIIRERSVYSMCTNLICRKQQIPAILYNQSPLWDREKKMDWQHKLVWKLVPEYRITPVRYNYRYQEKDTGKLVEDIRTKWVPFVMELKLQPEQKVYFQGNTVTILMIGKYQERKNHLMLLRVFEKLCSKYQIELVMAGECSTPFHERYYERVEQYIREHYLESKVTLYKNQTRQQVFELYRNADVFVLPSTDEPAAISHLEAMAFSVPAICSTGNGTADYIIEDQTGYIFEDKDEEDLFFKLEQLVKNREKIVRFGWNAYEHVKKDFSFQSYYKKVMEIYDEISKR